MTPFIIGNIQFSLSLIVYIMIARWYILPGLRNMEWKRAIVLLLLIHAFRFGPLTLLMPGQVSGEIPPEVAQTIAYGDLISGVLAIIAAILIWNNVRGAKLFGWIFTIFGFGDIVLATYKGIGAGLLDKDLGFNLYILNFYVPLLIVTHILIIQQLVKKE